MYKRNNTYKSIKQFIQNIHNDHGNTWSFIYNKLMRNNINIEQYLSDWPNSYYEIEDINLRQDVLEKQLELHPNSKEDQLRLDLLQRRFGRSRMQNRPDHFVHNLILIEQFKDKRVNAKNTEELLTLFLQLGVHDEITEQLNQEWINTIETYRNLTNKSYSRPAFLGMGKRTDTTVESHVDHTLHVIFVDIPKKYHIEQYVQPLLEII